LYCICIFLLAVQSGVRASCRHASKSSGGVGGVGSGRLSATTPVIDMGTSGFLSSVVSAETGVGSPDCPWMVRARPGQRINVTLLNFIGQSIGRFLGVLGQLTG